MSVVKENKKEAVNFSGIPLYIKDQILQKMNFKTYGTYMMTGKEAGALSARNDKFIYAMPIYRMTIKNDHVSFMDGLQIKMISFEKCEKMKLRPQIVVFQDLSLSTKTCDFLLKLDEIPTFECAFLDRGVPYIAEFFNKAKIGTLKMSMVKFVDEVFDYNTRHIEKVEIYNKKIYTPFDILDIKAQSSLTLNAMQIRPDQIYLHLLELMNGSQKPDLILKNCEIHKVDWVELMAFLYRDLTQKDKSTFVLNVGDESLAEVHIQSFKAPFCLTIKGL